MPLPFPITDPKNQQGIDAMNQALVQELNREYFVAIEEYNRASRLLHRAKHNLSRKTEEGRRIELQIQVVLERKAALMTYLEILHEGRAVHPPEPLPSKYSVEREEANAPREWVSLTTMELSRQRLGAANVVSASSSSAAVPEQPPPSPFSVEPPRSPISEIHHIAPFLSVPGFLITPSLPARYVDSPITYHIYSHEHERSDGSIWVQFLVKNANKSQTMYLLEGHKKPYRELIRTMLSRAGECHSPCVVAKITPVASTQFGPDSRLVGRPLTFVLPEMRGTSRRNPRKSRDRRSTSSKETMGGGEGDGILEAPDRLNKPQWNPRRLSYGGQRFVWKEGKNSGISSLYEVVKEWPDSQSKTGKVLDEVCLRPLMWGESKWVLAKEKICTVHLAVGLDQRFREVILTSELTRQMIQIHG